MSSLFIIRLPWDENHDGTGNIYFAIPSLEMEGEDKEEEKEEDDAEEEKENYVLRF